MRGSVVNFIYEILCDPGYVLEFAQRFKKERYLDLDTVKQCLTRI